MGLKTWDEIINERNKDNKRQIVIYKPVHSKYNLKQFLQHFFLKIR